MFRLFIYLKSIFCSQLLLNLHFVCLCERRDFPFISVFEIVLSVTRFDDFFQFLKDYLVYGETLNLRWQFLGQKWTNNPSIWSHWTYLHQTPRQNLVNVYRLFSCGQKCFRTLMILSLQLSPAARFDISLKQRFVKRQSSYQLILFSFSSLHI